MDEESMIVNVTVSGRAGSGKTQVVSVIREACRALGIDCVYINPEGDLPATQQAAADLKRRDVQVVIEEKR